MRFRLQFVGMFHPTFNRVDIVDKLRHAEAEDRAKVRQGFGKFGFCKEIFTKSESFHKISEAFVEFLNFNFVFERFLKFWFLTVGFRFQHFHKSFQFVQTFSTKSTKVSSFKNFSSIFS